MDKPTDESKVTAGHSAGGRMIHGEWVLPGNVIVRQQCDNLARMSAGKITVASTRDDKQKQE